MYSRTRDEGFGAEVKRRIMLGTYVLSAGYYDAFYLKAQQVRTLLRRDYDAAFEKVDVVAMPTSPIPAFRLGEKTADPLQMYLADVFTVSANLAGPAGHQHPVRLRRRIRSVSQSACRSLGKCSTSRRCSGWPTRTSGSRTGTRRRRERRNGFEPYLKIARSASNWLASVSSIFIGVTETQPFSTAQKSVPSGCGSLFRSVY